MVSRVALVTGGSRGIGRAIAGTLAGDGHRIAVNYAANAAAADEVVAEITAAGGE
ncbi:MAG: SDR family NAD(P)-dependent oxidoreductase, partial [Acidimicrobiia bacterium]|nr:SDR family NAD(P)-dependent oxidoreductase [Acidimicrobiia bacterium]